MVVVTPQPPEKGQYLLSQLCIQVGQLHFLKSVMSQAVSFGVVHDLPSLDVQPVSGQRQMCCDVKADCIICSFVSHF